MLIREIAAAANTTARTIQRDIEAYNKANGTDHLFGLKDDVTDEELLLNIEQKREVSLLSSSLADDRIRDIENAIIDSFQTKTKVGIVKSHPYTADLSDDSKESRPVAVAKPKKERKGQRLKASKQKKTDLQTLLSANWMVLVVLFVVLWVDMFCFGVIGNNEFGEKWGLAWLPFSVIGLAVGFGSIVTYNRINDEKLANTWKYVFGVLQLCLFEFVVNDWLILGGVIVGIMFVSVSIGTQRSIKG